LAVTGLGDVPSNTTVLLARQPAQLSTPLTTGIVSVTVGVAGSGPLAPADTWSFGGGDAAGVRMVVVAAAVVSFTRGAVGRGVGEEPVAGSVFTTRVIGAAGRWA
jgi:hypothetical protein